LAAELRSAPLCTALSVLRYSVRSFFSPAHCAAEKLGSAVILRSKLASRAASMPLACSAAQYWPMSSPESM